MELSDWKFKVNMINIYTKGSDEKSRQCARTDGSCKQRDGNPKKIIYIYIYISFYKFYLYVRA